MKTKLYTEAQLLDICKSVAEKAIATSIPEEWIKDKCDYYGHSKIHIDLEKIEDLIEDDDVETINVEIKLLSYYHTD